MSEHQVFGRLQSAPARILYVEMHSELRVLMIQFLEYFGHCCVAAASREEALENIASTWKEFDLVIIAHETPHLDGLALAQELRIRAFRGRIMFYCMELDESDHPHCQAYGVDAIVRKPTPGRLILQKITALCRL